MWAKRPQHEQDRRPAPTQRSSACLGSRIFAASHSLCALILGRRTHGVPNVLRGWSFQQPSCAFGPQGSLLYDIFEWQSWVALVAGGLLSFNLIW